MTDLLKVDSADQAEYEIAFSCGGATAVLAAAGAVAACHMAGIHRFRRVMGVSGGAIFGSILSTGISTREAVRMVVETQFGDHISFKDGILQLCRRLKAFLLNYPASPASRNVFKPVHVEWPVTGIMDTRNLGAHIRKHCEQKGIKGWPQSFVTMATTRYGSQVIFSAEGVCLKSIKGDLRWLSREPVPVDLAVRASATIPGVMAAIEYKEMMLFDGGLSRDGFCPVGFLIKDFGANPKKIIACRVGEDILKPVSGRLTRWARLLWMVHPEYHWGPETAGVIEFRPEINHVHSLKFELTPDEKWLAILVSFEAASARFALEGILKGENLQRVQKILNDLGHWRDYIPAPAGAPQVLADRASRIFMEHGLY